MACSWHVGLHLAPAASCRELGAHRTTAQRQCRQCRVFSSASCSNAQTPSSEPKGVSRRQLIQSATAGAGLLLTQGACAHPAVLRQF